MAKDAIVDKYLEKNKHLPQFRKEEHGGRVVKFRFCRLCSPAKKVEAGEAFRSHMARHW